MGHSYNSLVTAILLLPYEGGTLMGISTDAFTDRVTGFASVLAKPIGRSKMKAAVMPIVLRVKARAEEMTAAARRTPGGTVTAHVAEWESPQP